MTVAVVCTVLLAAMLFLLGANVSRQRARRSAEGGTQLPTDPADPLFIAIRAHGNAAEYVPTMMILFLLLGSQVDTWWSATLIIAATTARVLHAIGMLTAPSLAAASGPRLIGAVGTYLVGLALAGAALTAL